MADPAVLSVIQNINLLESLIDETVPNRFCNRYLEWIKSTQSNTLIGLDNFPHMAYSNGTTEAFDKFYAKNHTRRFRCFKAEYMYHQLTWRNNWPNWKFVEDEELHSNDALIISLPFADTGEEHPRYTEVLKRCNELGIPVLVDCVYFGVCESINFDLSYDCITDVTFSLSKQFPVAHARIGMRLTRTDDDDSLDFSYKNGYNNRIGPTIGLLLLENFTPDYTVKKYKHRQIEFCRQLKIRPSKTVLFGIDEDDQYPEYNRGGNTNRLSLHKFLPTDIEHV